MLNCSYFKKKYVFLAVILIRKNLDYENMSLSGYTYP